MSFAVGVMARAPLPGFCKTRLAEKIGDEAAAELAAAMLEDTLNAYAQLPAARHILFGAPEHDGLAYLRRFIKPPWRLISQSGDDLGVRMQRALEVLGESAAVTALAGSDIPHVDIAAVAAGLERLERAGDVLLGPADDGGYYFIATRVPTDALFVAMPWGASTVFDLTVARCKELQLGLDFLPRNYDIDSYKDLLRLRDALTGQLQGAPATKEVVRRRQWAVKTMPPGSVAQG